MTYVNCYGNSLYSVHKLRHMLTPEHAGQRSGHPAPNGWSDRWPHLTIPAKIVGKIVRGEFVDLNTLLDSLSGHRLALRVDQTVLNRGVTSYQG